MSLISVAPGASFRNGELHVHTGGEIEDCRGWRRKLKDLLRSGDSPLHYYSMATGGKTP